jgi:hypothetical protein
VQNWAMQLPTWTGARVAWARWRIGSNLRNTNATGESFGGGSTETARIHHLRRIQPRGPYAGPLDSPLQITHAEGKHRKVFVYALEGCVAAEEPARR